MLRMKAAGEGALLASRRKNGRARVGAAVPPRQGRETADRVSRGLSFLHSLTRRSREHLRSGKDRKTAGIMVTPESAAGTGAGVGDCRRWG